MVFLAVLVLAAGIRALTGIANDHSWGGDWAQYLLHAGNILEVSDYQRGLSGYPPAPISYVLLLAVASLTGMPIFVAGQLLNFLFFGGICVILFRVVRKTSNVLLALLTVLFLLLNPTYLYLAYQIGPGLTFIFFVVATLSVKPGSRIQTVCLVLAASMRIEGFILALALMTDRSVPIRRRWNQLFLGLGAMVMATFMLSFLTRTEVYGASHGSTRQAFGVLLTPSLLVDNLRQVALAMQDLSISWLHILSGNDTIKSTAVAIIVLVITIGASVSPGPSSLRQFRISSGLFLAFFALIAIIFRVGSAGSFPGRYLAVVLALILPTLCKFASNVSNQSTLRPTAVALLLSFLIAVSIFPEGNGTSRWYNATNFEESVSLVTNEEVLGFVKPRTLQFAITSMTGGESAPEIISLRTAKAVEYISDRGGCAIVEITSGYGQTDIRALLQASSQEGTSQLIYQSDWREVYCFG